MGEAKKEPSARAVAEYLLHGAVDTAIGNESRGCMGVISSVACQSVEPSIRDDVNRRAESAKQLIVDRMEQAIKAGEFFVPTKAEAITRFLLTHWGQPGAGDTSIRLLKECFPDDESVVRHIFHVRFGQRVPCPTCHRPATWRWIASARSYRAGCCRRHQIIPTTGTLFDRSRTSLTQWLELMLFFASVRSGISADLTKKLLGVIVHPALKTIGRIRSHIALLEVGRMVGGPGQPVHVAFKMLKGVRHREFSGGGTATLLIFHDWRSVVAVPVDDRKTKTIHMVATRIVKPGSILVYPDEVSARRLGGYGHNNLISNDFSLMSVQHFPGLPNLLEGYWTGFRRIMRATHMHVQRDNVWKYVNEFSFRFNRVHRLHESFWDMISHFPLVNTKPWQ